MFFALLFLIQSIQIIRHIYFNYFGMFKMRKRTFLISQFIQMLLVIRLFTVHLLSIEIFLAFIALMLFAQYFKQGFTPIILVLLPLLSLQIYGELNQLVYLQYIASILGGILHFIPMKMYWLPQPLKVVGFKEDSLLQSGLHYYQFYPLDESENIELKSIKWHIGKELSKMLEYIKLTNRILNKIGRLVLSYADHHNLKIGQGAELLTDSSIAFCHGRGGTPFTYTSFLMHFAGLKFKVGAVQHNEVGDTGLTDDNEIKKFREKQVQARAAEYYQTILKVNKSRIVLIGHSYGCSTIIQAYHSLQKQMKDKISHIVLLDPWFFPLTTEKFTQQINCPILILANQLFVKNQDVYKRNTEFLKIHKVQYINWKNGDHLHQTDMGFINGNLLGIIKNSHLSQIMFDLNIQAIDRFLRNEKVEGTFGEKDLGRNYAPKYHPNKFPL